ncbi:MAG TPA: ribosome maturation factor RimP [Terriglobales bacterium]|nr:ribosome maturation factor RimP [Terriglobales bacterium]
MQDDEQIARVERVIEPVVQHHGLTLVDLEWKGDRRRGILRLYVDKAGGVGIGDCERLSRELGDLLDAEGVIDHAYDLEVSSPGLDRQLRKDREFNWALGKPVRCWLAGGEEHFGRLAEVAPERLVLDRDGTRVELPRQVVTKARLEIDVPWPRA